MVGEASFRAGIRPRVRARRKLSVSAPAEMWAEGSIPGSWGDSFNMSLDVDDHWSVGNQGMLKRVFEFVWSSHADPETTHG